LVQILENPTSISADFQLVLGALGGINTPGALEETVNNVIKQKYRRKFSIYTDQQIVKAAKVVFGKEILEQALDDYDIDQQEAFRFEEYNVLKQDIQEEALHIQSANLSLYDQEVMRYFSCLTLIKKLQETRVLTGFTRVFANNEQSLTERKAMLRKQDNQTDNWLPAYQVFGEGLFFEFDEARLSDWEGETKVANRVKVLNETFSVIQQKRHLQELEIIPRFVLIHTFAHLLMKRLTFECGYSSAALRERLYISNHPDKRMSGVLIYTADGDAEGTMGGLVRMGKPEYIEPVIQRALQDATWCSVDPVCAEIGSSGGQGPDSCNLAACHNCALVPETACEQFNRFLDRTVVVGDINEPDIGFFQVRSV
jgi:hypothetical protein